MWLEAFPDPEELAPPLAVPATFDPEALLPPLAELAVFVPPRLGVVTGAVTTGAAPAVAGGAEVAGGSVVAGRPVLTGRWVVSGRPPVIETGVWAGVPCSEAGIPCRGAELGTTAEVELVEVVDVPGWWAVTNAWQKVLVPARPPWAAMSALNGVAEVL